MKKYFREKMEDVVFEDNLLENLQHGKIVLLKHRQTNLAFVGRIDSLDRIELFDVKTGEIVKEDSYKSAIQEFVEDNKMFNLIIFDTLHELLKTYAVGKLGVF